MKKTYLTFVCVLLVPALLVGVSSSATYDAWSDLDADGDVDLFDAVTFAGSYGTTGDATKNVNVVNWPTSTDVGVWWMQNLPPSTTLSSSGYRAEGFGQLHVLVRASGLGAGESVTIVIYGELVSTSGGASWLTEAYTTTLTSSFSWRDITIPVPSAWFRFYASTDAATNCNVYLSFYLTWS